MTRGPGSEETAASGGEREAPPPASFAHEELARANAALRAEVLVREQAELRARRQERFLESIVENIPDMIFVKDAAELRFVLFNRAGEELLGHPRADLHGKNDHDLFPAEEADFFTAKDREVLEEGRAFDIPEERIHTGDRGVRLLHTKKIPILDERGRPEYLLGISEDITERRHAEEQLRAAELALVEQAAELQRSNAELDQFAGVASHDLQEPLRKIQAFGQLLPDALGREIPPAARDYLDRMLAAADRMQSLIHDLLTFSRVSTQPRMLAEVDLGQIAREVIGDLALEPGARVTVGELPRLRADRLQMRQLLQNLIGNALKFHERGVPARVDVSARQIGGAWELAIADEGIGFEEKYLDRIFRPFQRLHTAKEFHGTGIGLAICKKIAEHHGGILRATSTLGEGSIFVVALPAG
jgi:PAS domain S-box-containing protein